MEAEAAKLIGAGLATSGMIGAGVGLGVLFGNYLQAAIRNPSAAASQQTMLFLGMALTGLELVVAFLQAFVFTVLATVYLNEVVNFGHGH